MMFPKSKYKAKRIPKAIDGIGWDSQAERDYYYSNLLFQEKAGRIKNIELHASVQLTKFIKWKVDYVWIDVESGRKIWCEFKGVETEAYKLKKNLWKEFGPGELRIVKGCKGMFKVVEIINPRAANEN